MEAKKEAAQSTSPQTTDKASEEANKVTKVDQQQQKNKYAGLSLSERLRLKAEENVLREQAIKDQLAEQAKKPVKTRFRLKRSQSKEQRQAEKRLRKAHKKKQKELKKLSEKDKHVYMELSDPSNPVMQVMRYGGDKELQEIYKRDIWESIREKHRLLHS